MSNKTVFTKGFEVDGVRFGWHNKQLYQLPYTANGKSYGLRLVRPKIMKGADWLYYHIRRNKCSLHSLLDKTQTVNWEVENTSL